MIWFQASDGFGGWNEIHPGYGGTSVPVPADYDGPIGSAPHSALGRDRA